MQRLVSTWERVFGKLRSKRRGKKGKGLSTQKFRRLVGEPLEERTLLSLCVWDGGGTDNKWTTAANWVGDVAPVRGDDLRFSGAVQTDTENDYTAGTSFRSINFAASGFEITGNNLTLTNNITVNSGVTGSTISAGIGLDGTTTINVVNTSLTIFGVISGEESVFKTGTGTLVIAGACNNWGTTTINAGTLQIDNGGSLRGKVVNNASLVFNRSDAYSYGGRISGSGSVIQSGTGTLTLDNYNSTFTGATTINAGTLAFSNMALGSTGSITIGGNARLKWNGTNTTDLSSRLVIADGVSATFDIGSNNVTFASGITTAGNHNVAVTKTGSGTLTIAGACDYTGTTTIAAGTLQINNSVSLLGDIVNNGALVFNRSDAYTWNGVISGGGSLTKNNTGTLTLTAANTYTGRTTINAGTVAFESGAFGGGEIWVGTATLRWLEGNTEDISSQLVIKDYRTATFDIGSNDVTFASGVHSEYELEGGMTKLGSGTLTIAGTSHYYGDTTISEGTVQIDSGGTLGGDNIINNGTLIFNRSEDCSRGDISGSGSVVQNGTGTLTLTGTNTYTGGTTINTGALAFSNGALGSTGSVTIGGNAQLKWNGTNTTDLSSRLVIADGVSATLDFGSNNVTFASGITTTGNHNVAVTKTGSGTLTIGGACDYTGTTTIAAGTLQINNGGSVAGNIINNTSLIFNRSDTYAWNGVISGGGTLTKNNTGTLTFTGANTYTGQTTINAGTVAFESGTFGSGEIWVGTATLRWLEGNTEDISSQLVIEDYRTATLDIGSNDVTFASGVHSEYELEGGMTKLGSGTLTITGTSHYYGDTTISEGTVQIDSGGTLGGDNIINNGTLIFNLSEDCSCGDISGVGAVVQNGTGILTLTDTNTYTGGTTIRNGTVEADDIDSLGSGDVVVEASGTLTYDGTTLDVAGVAISGTEIYHAWDGKRDDTEYTIAESSDGLNFSSLGRTIYGNIATVTIGLERDTTYDDMWVVADNGSDRTISYQLDSITTLDLADTSGWYRISNEPFNVEVVYSAYDYTEFMTDFDGARNYAGSSQGAIIRELVSCITSTTLPTVGAGGAGLNVNTTTGEVVWYFVATPHDEDNVTFDGNERPSPFSGLCVTQYTDVCTGPLTDCPGRDADTTTDPIFYYDGSIAYTATDLESDALANGLALSRNWVSDSIPFSDGNNGNGWLDSTWPSLANLDGDTMAIVYSANDIATFISDDGVTYEATSYISDTLVHNTTNHTFTLTDSAGNQYIFYDFSLSVSSELRGKFISMTDAGGVLAEVTSRTSAGEIETLTRYGSDGTIVMETWTYSYIDDASDPNIGLLESVTLRQLQDGVLTVVQQVTYTYYEGTYTGDDTSGNVGDLKTAITTDADGAVLDVSYYRYYTSDETSGYPSGLKYIFDTKSYYRLLAAESEPFSAADEDVAEYAQQYFEYDNCRRVIRQDIQGMGTFTFLYSVNENFSDDTNTWQYKTVETTPDGSVNIVYCNALGEAILKLTYADETLAEQVTAAYYEYDTLGRLALEADALAIANCTADTDVGTGYILSLSANSGAIYEYEYYTITTATETTTGGAKGYFHKSTVQEGTGGTASLLEAVTYYARVADTTTVYYVASDTVYTDGTTSTAETTTYAYTWHTDTVRVATVTETLPTSAQTTAVYNIYGQTVQLTDALGTVTTYTYDQLGRVTKTIENYVDGVFSAASPDEDVTTTYAYDALGRVTKMTDAAGSTTYYVYSDEDREIRIYTDWDSTANNTTGAITVLREDLSGAYNETLTYVWTDPNGLAGYLNADGSPDGTESLTSTYASLQTLARELLDSSGQTVAYREYFYLTGLAYSTDRNLGTKDVNYYETSYEYGAWDDVTSVTDALGNATSYTYDAFGEILSMTDALDNVTTYEYDGNGNLVSVTDAANVVTTYEYNYLGQMVEACENYQNGVHETTDGADEDIITSYTYDFLGNLLTVTDAAGVVTVYEYNAVGQVVKVCENYQDGVHDATDAADEDVITTYTYNLLGDLLTVTDALGNETEYEYNALWQLVSVTDVLDNVTTYEYDALGDLISVIDALGNETVYTYDALGQMVEVCENYQNGVHETTDAADEDVITTYEYDALGNLASVTDTLGNETEYTYNAFGELVSVTDTLDNVTTYEYDAIGNLVSVTDALGNETEYEYNAFGELVSVTDALDNVTTYEYDAVGNLVSVTDAAGVITVYTYDALGQMVEVCDNYQNGVQETTDAADEDVITTYEYDAVGNLVSVTDALGNETVYAYNARGELTSTTDANGDATTYIYDALGNLLTLTDAEGNETEYTYDALGQVLTETDELDNTESYEYDAVGNLVETTDSLDRVISYQYDDLGRVTQEDWLDSQGISTYTISYTYDALGYLLTASDDAATYAYEYDALGRLVEQTQTLADLSPVVILAYTYDEVGNCTQVSQTVGGTADAVTDYAYDDLGRVTSIQQHGVTGGNAVAEKRVDFTYDAVGAYATVTVYADLAGNELVSTAIYTFDDAYQLTGLTYTQDATSLAYYTYVYDDAGNLTSMTTVDGTTTYTHDDTGQLTATDSNYTDDEAYTYDDNGNRVTANGDTYTTDDDNQLLSDGTYRYLYDAEGNRIVKYVDDGDGVLDAGDTDITTYDWDYRNRLTAVATYDDYTDYAAGTSSTTVAYTYDYANRLIGRTLDADGTSGTGDLDQTVYVYDGDQVVSRFDNTYADGAATDATASDLSHRYLWNSQAIDHLFADEQVDSLATEGDMLYALTDHQGSVRDLAVYDAQNDETTIANHRIYDSYGNLESETNAAVDCLFGYTGRQFDEATGLQNNLNRWYDAATGRWLSEDPIGFAGGDANLYRYCGNSPAGSIDPDGLETRERTHVPGQTWDPQTNSYYTVEIIRTRSGYAWLGFGYSDNVTVKKHYLPGYSPSPHQAQAWQRNGQPLPLEDRLILGVRRSYHDAFGAAQDRGRENAAVSMYEGLSTAGCEVLVGTTRLARSADDLRALDSTVGRRRLYKDVSQSAPNATRSTVRANQAAGNAARDAIAAREAPALIEQNLRVTGGLRRIDVLKQGNRIVGIESKVGRTGLGRSGSRVRQELARDIKLLRSGQVDEIVWEFSRSARTGKIGPTGPLRQALKKHGITIRITDQTF